MACLFWRVRAGITQVLALVFKAGQRGGAAAPGAPAVAGRVAPAGQRGRRQQRPDAVRAGRILYLPDPSNPSEDSLLNC